jgi:predicted nucleic acid-binding protein
LTVIDASVVFVALTAADRRGAAARRALDDDLAAPTMVRAEVASALRGETWAGRLDERAGSRALTRCTALPITLFPIEPHLPRVWDLRHNVTPYDAWYVALAEALDAPLLTTDARLARAPGIRCEVQLV